MITTKKADLLTEPVDAILHQANCFHVHGGLAGAIMRKWPTAAIVDLHTPEGDLAKLGKVSIAYDNGMNVVNMYGQFHPGPDTRPEAVRNGLLEAKERLSKLGIKTLGIPYMMGCGIGGGDWTVIEGLITSTFADAPFDVIICKKD